MTSKISIFVNENRNGNSNTGITVVIHLNESTYLINHRGYIGPTKNGQSGRLVPDIAFVFNIILDKRR